MVWGLGKRSSDDVAMSADTEKLRVQKNHKNDKLDAKISPSTATRSGTGLDGPSRSSRNLRGRKAAAKCR